MTLDIYLNYDGNNPKSYDYYNKGLKYLVQITSVRIA